LDEILGTKIFEEKKGDKLIRVGRFADLQIADCDLQMPARLI